MTSEQIPSADEGVCDVIERCGTSQEVNLDLRK